MHTIIKGYKSASDFATQYTGKRGKVGVSRTQMHFVIKKEMTSPGTTDIDVLEIAGHYYVRYRGVNDRSVEVITINEASQVAPV
jgi:hypothetical protein